MFLTQLLLLFRFCPTCKADKPLVSWKRVGTMVEITTTCGSQTCSKRNNTWRSQPIFPGTKIPAGNLLLSFAILLAGTSATKTLRVFSHMGLASISLTTFFVHQRVSNFLCVHYYFYFKARESTRVLPLHHAPGDRPAK